MRETFINDVSDATCSCLRNRACLTDEYQCSDGTCIPHMFLCDGRKDCLDGRDEGRCVVETIDTSAISMSLTLGIIAGCIFLLSIIGLVVLFFIWQRNRRRNISNSGNEPLKPESNYTDVTSHHMCLHHDNHPLMPTKDSVHPLITQEEQMVVKGEKEKTYSKTENGNLTSIMRRSMLLYQPFEQQSSYNMFSSLDIDFGEELLCTSTPKQGKRGQLRPIITLDTSPIKDTSKGDLSKALNLSMFSSIT
ncbi:Low-density lipoprotein receptor [Mizuhopecten yessoensis]|uniref:Low-density lipoprotein receptor n=1 Tax=Mizuhopecten yessoensis TaxID=6573 RepID=A0A210PN89_MIZYE|nr:Low-density lipoprotein receptor [Mizuhopecten yessoensis]